MYAHEDRTDITKLNKLLGLADTRLHHPGLHLMLWKTYRRLIERYPDMIHAIPDRAWDIFWRIQERWASSRTGLKRLAMLETDMATCGYYEPAGRRIKYLEDLFVGGQEEQALKEWSEDYEGSNGLSRHDYKPEHLELGARLHALSGHPDFAREIMYELFELYPSWDPSIIKIVFRAHTSSPSPEHHNLANQIYKKSKERIGDKLALEDYDAYFVGFLEARDLFHAKLVFRDMIKEGHLAKSNGREDVKPVLSRLHMLFRLGTDISKMTSIGLQAVTSLPPAYHSHIFAHWMRSAVVRNAPEAAGQILEMMFRRNSQPETIHFNLLLKALMRTSVQQPEHNPYVSKAENIGWRMIEEARKVSVKNLPGVSAAKLISQWVDERKELVPDDEALNDQLRHVPRANMTTFAIMMKHHGDKEQWEHVDYLARQLQEGGLQPNTALMNILMDNKCRQGKYSEAWKIYKSFTEVLAGTPGVFPNGSSIRSLWKTLRLALGEQAAREDPNLPRPRELLAETVQWWERCRARHDAERFMTGLAATEHGALTSLMMHCFSYTNDLAGSLVGMHILHKKFDIAPSDKSAMILQRHASWVDMRQKGPIERSVFRNNRIFKKNLEKMGRVYYILLERRLEEKNFTPDDLANGSLAINVLSEFIRVVLKRAHPPESVEAIINQAKEEIGIPDMSTGDMDALQVV